MSKLYGREAAWASVLFVSFFKLVYGKCMLHIRAVVVHLTSHSRHCNC